MSSSSFLYDALGPRGNRRVRWYSAAFAAVALGVLYLIGQKLAVEGQLSEEKWGPLVNPSNPNFGPLWTFLAGGLVNTLIVAALAIVCALLFGTAMALARVTSRPWYRWFVVSVIEVLRGIPVVLLIFFVARVLPEVGIGLSTMTFLVIGLTLYNGVVIAEILRGGLQALPRGQKEAAQSLGLSSWNTLRLVLLPQAFRMMLPALIGQLIVVVKETSLGFIISYEELLRRGQIAIQSLSNPLQLFFIIAVIYIIINLGLTLLTRKLERGAGKKTAKTPGGRQGAKARRRVPDPIPEARALQL
ncbi:amino acid ABC transporter permease [Arthrobacter sp. SDTb3-6]|uniref:amino acid ABC transporter permease n=1 Tax=Arthrobacter sp. SDTb3-6 TaxID=2713571 RepID=UPI00159D1CCE|nr:amino acid ABC transporter permease [Arthrobacter sp. SDTb3-6]NVN00037.1 amino acid ABC transporter permease [Arthrobacter sp. SDTb3-6]